MKMKTPLLTVMLVTLTVAGLQAQTNVTESTATAFAAMQEASSNALQSVTVLDNEVGEPAPGPEGLNPSRISALQGQGQDVQMSTMTQTPPQCVTPPSGLVSFWNGQWNAGDVVGTNSGTLQGGAGLDGGQVGNAFSFNGQGQAVSIPWSPSLVSNVFSFEAWIEPLATVSAQSWIFGQGYGRQLTVRPGSPAATVAFDISDQNGNWVELTKANVIPIGGWTHVVSSYDGRYLRIFVNGTCVAQGDAGAGKTARDAGCAFGIGGAYNSCGYSGQWFNGLIDEVSYYNVALSTNTVQALYAAGSAGKCPSVPWVLVEPESQRVPVGTNVDLSVFAVGAPTLLYQWRWNGSPLEGATDWGLSLNSPQIENSGLYSVVVSNSIGSATSSNALVEVYLPICAEPPAGLVGWWTAEGNALDALGARNGTTNGGFAFAGGEVGQAFSFDGVNGTVIVPDSPALQLTSQITIEAWINARATAGDQSLVAKMGGSGGNNGYQFVLHNNSLQAMFNSPGQPWPSSTVSSPPLIASGLWYHVAWTYDQSAMKLYVNGLPVATNAIGANPIATSTSNLRISGDDNNHVYFNGLIDEASIYSTALSAQQIQAIYEAGVAGKCPWAFDLDGNGVPDAREDANHNGIPDGLEAAMGYNPAQANGLGTSQPGYGLFMAQPRGNSQLP
jgi:hypothetical protein